MSKLCAISPPRPSTSKPTSLVTVSLLPRPTSHLHLGLLGGDAEPKADLVFLYVKAGMTVIVDDGKDWRIDSGS